MPLSRKAEWRSIEPGTSGVWSIPEASGVHHSSAFHYACPCTWPKTTSCGARRPGYVWSTPFIFIKMRVAWELPLGVRAAIENAVEEDEMKSKLFALMLLAGSALMAGPRFFVGVGFGGYYGGYVAPAPVYYAPP